MGLGSGGNISFIPGVPLGEYIAVSIEARNNLGLLPVYKVENGVESAKINTTESMPGISYGFK